MYYFISTSVIIVLFVTAAAFEIVFAFVGEEAEHAGWVDPCLVEVGGVVGHGFIKLA